MTSPFSLDHTPQPGQLLQLEPGVGVVTAPNPGPMTFTGTQSYLVGDSDLAVIDPGPANPQHMQALLDAVAGRPVRAVLVTHSHLDHSPLAHPFARMVGAPVMSFGTAASARSAVMQRLAQEGDLGGAEGIDPDFAPDEHLPDGAGIAGDSFSLRALHTPGHLSDHLSFEWPDRKVLFSGDHVMGWATTLVSPPDGDLTAFMASLRRLQGRGDRIFYPGHGQPIEEPKRIVDYILAHRLRRESQILAALADGPATPAELTQRIYTDIDPKLLPAASRNVLAHLIDLHGRENVAPQGPLTQSARFAVK